MARKSAGIGLVLQLPVNFEQARDHRCDPGERGVALRLERAANLVSDVTRVRVGVDIISDGEIRRESYSNRFATALEGVVLDNPGQTTGRMGNVSLVPRIVGPIRRTASVQVAGSRSTH